VALLVQDYRALLAGMLVGTLVDVSLTYRFTRFRPRFTLAYKDEVLAFSAWWLASRVMTILGRKGQLLLIGQQLEATVLGKYAVALDLATMPTVEIIAPVMRAVYPGYMQMKDEVGRLYFAFLKVWGTIALIAIPAAVGVASVAELLTSVLLGPKWREAAQLMGPLAVIGAIEALNGCFWPMLLTRFGSKTVFLLSSLGVCLKLPVFGVALWVFGLMPAIGAWIACSMLTLLLGGRLLLRDLGRGMTPLLLNLVRPVAGASLMAGALWGAQHLLPSVESWIGEFLLLVLLVAGGALVYILTVWFLWWLSGGPNTAERELVSLLTRLTRMRTICPGALGELL
jgi:O-antigen/teichoic acid export membrane protein